ncbi:hypothetical protein SAMN05660293_03396 [Dyadobacter psychrophilus]|uniref:Uncharacterized protein n=1 Tax=Dyadobacter psychrophilus TaxID=651661 RepID=A0A1T5FT58_9BACT|nr:hypothetical protein SAMN05660293_03396 [Dyadobacter psychrophilus]
MNREILFYTKNKNYLVAYLKAKGNNFRDYAGGYSFSDQQ